jgi:hypothetical protein
MVYVGEKSPRLPGRQRQCKNKYMKKREFSSLWDTFTTFLHNIQEAFWEPRGGRKGGQRSAFTH